jgi:PncC family amidohydrolase
LAEELVREFAARGKLIAAAESCTAGLVSDYIAGVPGASSVFWGSFVTYTADAKAKMLGIPEELINAHGAVSRPVALAMAEGALNKSGVSLAFSITGLAGPAGDGRGTPVGTVWIGLSEKIAELPSGNPLWSEAKIFHFTGSRNEVRLAAAVAALEEVIKRIKFGNIDKGEV